MAHETKDERHLRHQTMVNYMRRALLDIYCGDAKSLRECRKVAEKALERIGMEVETIKEKRERWKEIRAELK